MIQIEMLGDWRRVQRALATLPLTVRAAAHAGQKRAAKELVKIVKGHINKQDLGWSPLSPKSTSGDPRILVDTKAYYRAINVWETKGIFFAGVKRDAFDDEGNRITDYAILHEFGTPKMPARPLWGPSLDELGGFDGIRNYVLLSMYEKAQALRLKGFDIDIRL